MGRIVVGVDGSPGSMRALGWAVTEARVRSDVLDVVYAYEPDEWSGPYYYPTEHGVVGYLAAELPLNLVEEETRVLVLRQETHEAVRARAERVVADMLHTLGEDTVDLTIERSAVRAHHPATVLIERSAGADLLVVGSRGHGGLEEVVLGSVSHACVRHAVCPVVVVPWRDERQRLSGAAADAEGVGAGRTRSGPTTTGRTAPS